MTPEKDPSWSADQEFFPSQESAISVIHSTIGKEDESLTLPPDGQILIHTEGGGFRFLDKDKWPQLLAGGEQQKHVSHDQRVTSEPTLSSQGSGGDGEVMENGGIQLAYHASSVEDQVVIANKNQEVWEVVSTAKKTQVKRKFQPAVAARQSSRNQKSFTTSTLGGVSAIPGTSSTPSNSFEILNSCDNADLENIAMQCDLILGGGDTSETHEVLSAMKLEEKTRAALAEANYRQHLEVKLNETHALEGENLELEVIDNTERATQPEMLQKKKPNRGGGSKLSRSYEESVTNESPHMEHQGYGATIKGQTAKGTSTE